MRKILVLILCLIFSPAFAQQSVQIVNGGSPVGTSNQLPIAVYDSGNHTGYCYTSNGSGTAASFQTCGGGGGSTSIGSTISGGTQNSVLFLGASSVLAQDNANFNWNDASGIFAVGGITGIGNSASYPGTVIAATGAAASGGYIQYNCQDTTASGQCGYTATANDGTDFTHYSFFGMNNSVSPSPANVFFTNTHAASLYNADAEFDFGAGLVSGSGGNFNWYVNQYSTANMKLTSSGLSIPAFATAGVVTNNSSGLLSSTANLPYSNLTALSSNQVLGALTATTPSGLSVPSCSGASNALTWTSGTGFGCNTITGGVSSFSGDGTLISNASSTGAVTATLANAAANTVWGNNTSGSAAPGYQTSINTSGSHTGSFFNATTINTGYELNGSNALRYPSSDTTAGGSVAVGSSALSGQTSSAAYGSTAIGYQALNGTMTTANINNTAAGYQALGALGGANGYSNSAFGFQSCGSVTTGLQNSCFGAASGQGITTGSGDFALGYHSMQYSNASNTVAIGPAAIFKASGNYNIGIGASTGNQITSGANNVIIGPNVASTTLATGSNNLLIGMSSAVDTVSSSQSNEINIGGLLFWNYNSTAAPTVSSCGTNSIDVHANNRSGTVNITAGTPSSCTITFAGTGYGTWNHCRVTSQSVNAAFAYSYTTTVLTVTGTALAGKIDYDCDGV